MVTSFGVEPLSKEAFRGRIVGKSSVAGQNCTTDPRRGKKGPIRDHFGKEAFFSIASTLVLFGLLLTSAESRDGSPLTTLSSGIVRAQVPPRPPGHFNQANATDTACCRRGRGCPEPRGSQFKEAHRCATLPGLSFLVFLFFGGPVGWRGRHRGRDGGHGMHTDKHSDNLSARACWFRSHLPPHPSTFTT